MLTVVSVAAIVVNKGCTLTVPTVAVLRWQWLRFAVAVAALSL